MTFTVLAMLISTSASASVIYEFRNLGGAVLGTMEFADPPSSTTTAWASSNSADLQSLFLDDATFGLGTGDVLNLFSIFLTYDVASLNGSELDFALGIQDSTPGGAAGGISDFIQLSFSSTPGQDVVESFANAAFVIGDWTVRQSTPTGGNVPEPMPLVLFGFGLVGLGISRQANMRNRD